MPIAVVCTKVVPSPEPAIAGLEVREVPAPKATSPGSAVVSVSAAALNFYDLLQIQGKYQMKKDAPFVIGHEAAGTVVTVSPGANGATSSCPVGTRVIICLSDGLCQGTVVAPVERLVPLPPSWSFAEGAAFFSGYMTAFHAFVHRALIHPPWFHSPTCLTAPPSSSAHARRSGVDIIPVRRTVLVTGASGGMGLSACTLALLLGCDVIAGVSTDMKATSVKKSCAAALAAAEAAYSGTTSRPPRLTTAVYGADGAQLRDHVMEATEGRGADVAYEVVGGPLFMQTMRVMAPFGKVLIIGFTSGKIPTVAAGVVLVKGVDVVGVRAGAALLLQPGLFEDMRDAFVAMPPSFVDSQRPVLDCVVAPAGAAEGFRRMARREVVGKVVVQLDPSSKM
eukprot:TRINITY_DN33514_c0_g1_i1.p1 TRINITY_DN33514_c0_g1~~TRINITY_DN33514_c0_g1_i1.p1  ORF type:complete len:394 (+),score=74.45 TRINITY_DN33514_c0_g1_i1:140-1321(+)